MAGKLDGTVSAGMPDFDVPIEPKNYSNGIESQRDGWLTRIRRQPYQELTLNRLTVLNTT